VIIVFSEKDIERESK